jgi:hypothetical protein
MNISLWLGLPVLGVLWATLPFDKSSLSADIANHATPRWHSRHLRPSFSIS